jgi:hypothetical protein
MTSDAHEGLVGKIQRDPGLDFIRGLALVLMVSIHYARITPYENEFNNAFKDFAEAAPAFFFFGFGMTFDRFLAKTNREKWELNLYFLWVALAHNIVRAGLLTLNFLFSLWFWRVILTLLERDRRRPAGLYLAVCAATAAIIFVVPPAFFTRIREAVWGEGPGLLWLMPWGGFVLMGLVYSRLEGAAARWILLLALGGFTAACSVLHCFISFPGLALTKIPVSVPYLSFNCSLCILFIEIIRRRSAAYFRIPLVPALFTFMSKNLLLGTVLHYLVDGALIFVGQRAGRPGVWLPPMGPWESAYIYIGSLLAVSGVLVLIRFTNAGWAQIRNRGIIRWLRRRRLAVGAVIIAAMTILNLVKLQLESSPCLGKICLSAGAGLAARKLIVVAVVGGFIYLALELIEYRSRR